ncbi:MAG: ABC transporter substrate-binding protein [Devosia sp.]|jgi:trehalose/maltose transport system substrate-binding protein|uniref:ABC transporter substrate-binding protein n=1 Tax=unclassified Devosia TaxID=196773 RepID=UPI0019EDAFF4|nr:MULTISPECIES: ABC transporter substrate-binding protein [unclassified Devosia]MBF0677590.1 ABC transporter substrate-binding protein [Devosia sp.]WEJ34350.1 ABC transporter substrate-binding protein [Devosia sp. SD17-2]
MTLKKMLVAMMASVTLVASAAQAAELAIVSGDTGTGLQFLQSELEIFKEQSGHNVTIVPMPSSTSDQFGQYRLWLAAGNADIDVYQTDVIWAPQLADQFVDLTEAAADVVGQHFPSVIESQTVDGKLVAVPGFTDAPALYYRTDLLEKYGKDVPKTWSELHATAQEIMDGERAEGKTDMWGFVFQGNAYEGLTCNALEWVNSFGGGQIIEADGTISINNPQAVAALEEAASWIGTISPEGNLAYMEEESRGVWQLGNAVFMRNWPYAYALSNNDDSAVKGNFDVAPLPAGEGEGAKSSATLGGWNFAVSKYSANQEAAVELALFLSSEESQKRRAIQQANLPTVQSLYQDADVLAASPFMAAWEEIFQNAVPRPSAPTQANYNEASSLFWSAVHNTLSGNGSAAENLELLEVDLEDLLN